MVRGYFILSEILALGLWIVSFVFAFIAAFWSLGLFRFFLIVTSVRTQLLVLCSGENRENTRSLERGKKNIHRKRKRRKIKKKSNEKRAINKSLKKQPRKYTHFRILDHTQGNQHQYEYKQITHILLGLWFLAADRRS